MIHRPDDRPSHAPSMDPGTFRAAAHDLVDRVADFLASVPDRPVTPAPSPDAVREALGADRPLPEDGEDPGEVLGSASRLLFDGSLLNGHPRFFGYITSSPAPIGVLGELLAAAVNANAGAWVLSPVATEIEAQTVRWIAELIGSPSHGHGLLMSGGNMANITALFAARAAALGPGVRAAGPGEAEPRVYATAEAHTWLEKAMDMAGLGTDAIRRIATDADRRLDVGALREAIEADESVGRVPVMVVASAGTVSTGVVDPLVEIGRLCRERDVWFHVDGAYGAFAAAVPGAPRELEGMALADSIAVDPHKWLYSPLEAGCVLVRDPDALRAAFSYHPPYYHFGTEATNYFDLGPQNSRGFRALKVWLALRQAGRRGYVRAIAQDIHLAERLFARVDEHPELEAVTRSLSITTFRYVPPDLASRLHQPWIGDYLNLLNERLLDRIQASGEAFVSHAVLEGRHLLRACIVNLNTREEDVDALPDIVARLGRQVDASLRTPLDERLIARRRRAAVGESTAAGPTHPR